LLGPSGGYTLSARFLKSFDHIVAIDKDPLAGWRFWARHSLRNLEWHTSDFSRIEWLFGFTKKVQPSHILFSNCLGQMPLQMPVSWSDWKAELQEFIHAVSSTCEVASYHDRLSLSGPSLKALLEKPWDQLIYQSDQKLLEATQKLLRTGQQLEARTHETDDLFESLDGHFTYLVWPLTPKQYHIIEFFRSADV